MKRYTKKRSKKAWMAPGTLVHIGEKTVDITGITVIDYSETELREETLHNLKNAFYLKTSPRSPGSILRAFMIFISLKSWGRVMKYIR